MEMNENGTKLKIHFPGYASPILSDREPCAARGSLPGEENLERSHHHGKFRWAAHYSAQVDTEVPEHEL